MKLRNLNGLIRKNEERTVKVRLATPIGVITAGLSKSELIAGLAALGLAPTNETDLTVDNGYLVFEDGCDVFGSQDADVATDDEPTFDPDEIDLLGDSPTHDELGNLIGESDLLGEDYEHEGAEAVIAEAEDPFEDDTEDLLAL